MSQVTYREPSYTHREYSNDIGVPSRDRNWSDQTYVERLQRVTKVALPFITLYKPLSFPVSLGLGAIRTLSNVSQLTSCIHKGQDAKITAYQTLQTAIAIISLAGTVFAHPLGMLITTSQDLIIEVSQLAEHVQNGEYKKALESCAAILNNTLYLGLFLHGGLELSIASLGTQVLIGIYHFQTELKQGRYLEAIGHLGMALIRGKQMTEQISLLNPEEDVWARRCFNLASITLEPMCTVVWCGFRAVMPLGKFDSKANVVHEVALRALYLSGAAFLVIPGIPLGGISQIFRCAGWALQSNGCTHVKGTALDKDFTLDRQVKVMTFNIAAVPGGIAYKVAGVPHWKSRIDGIVNMIREQDPDVLVIEEAYDIAVQEELVHTLKDRYSHFFLEQGTGFLGGLGPGGVMTATKGAVKHFSDHKFDNNPFTQARSFGSFELLENSNATKAFARIIGTHPTWREGESEQRRGQWQQIQKYIAQRNELDGLPTIIAADTNFERDKEEGQQLLTWMQPCYQDLAPTCWHQFQRDWNPADTNFKSHENYPEYGEHAVYRPRQIDNIFLVKDGHVDQMHLDSCSRDICYDDPYSAPNDPSKWFDHRTAISDHHAVVAEIRIDG